MRQRGDASEGRQRNAALKHEHQQPYWTRDREESLRSSIPLQHWFLSVSLTSSFLCCALFLFFFALPSTLFSSEQIPCFFLFSFILVVLLSFTLFFLPVFLLSLFFNLSLHLLYFCWFNLCYFLLHSPFTFDAICTFNWSSYFYLCYLFLPWKSSFCSLLLLHPIQLYVGLL